MNTKLTTCTGKTKTIHHRTFCKTLITELWYFCNVLWKSRCTLLHNTDDINALANVELNDRIRPYVAHPLKYLGIGDLHFLKDGLQDTLSLSLSHKQKWLVTVARRAEIQREQ